MAHEITKSDRFGEVRGGMVNGAARQRAWHGLGEELPEGSTVKEGFDFLGMGWETGLFSLTTTLGDGKTINVPDFKAHVRMDNNDVLGIVSKEYKPISNQVMAEFADALVGADRAVRLETGGSLRGGRRVFALVKLPQDTEVLDGDVLNNYLCLSNGHDGMNAFRAFFTPIRVVCANTLAMAEASVSGARFAHDGDLNKKIELARAALGIIVKQSERFATQARKLAAVSLKSDSIKAYYDTVYGRTYGKVDDTDEGMTKDHYEKTTKQWFDNLSEARNTVKSTEGTAWHAFNAVTYFHDHQRGRLKNVSESGARVHSNLFGTSNKDKGIALRAALELVPA